MADVDKWLEGLADRHMMEDLERDDNTPDKDTIAEWRRENDEDLGRGMGSGPANGSREGGEA